MPPTPDLVKLFSAVHSLLGYIDSADTFKGSSIQPSEQWLEGLGQYADRVEAELNEYYRRQANPPNEVKPATEEESIALRFEGEQYIPLDIIRKLREQWGTAEKSNPVEAQPKPDFGIE